VKISSKLLLEKGYNIVEEHTNTNDAEWKIDKNYD